MQEVMMRFLMRIMIHLPVCPLSRPSIQEADAIAELKAAFRAFPVAPTRGVSPSEAFWNRSANRLRSLVLNHDPRKFLRWDVVLSTMFVHYASYTRHELSYLQGLTDWENRWRMAIEESMVGCPIRYPLYRNSSSNLIHHAYHLAKFEEKTCLNVDRMELVFEFGGGYGSMCRLFHNLGFKGIYVIFDLPHFSALQRYYLRLLGITVHKEMTSEMVESGVFCISDRNDLASLPSAVQRVDKSLFLATWSISETPLALRMSILPIINDANFSSFLLAYQHQFGEVNNVEFFKNWQKLLGNQVTWITWDIEHLPGNSYLMGRTQFIR